MGVGASVVIFMGWSLSRCMGDLKGGKVRSCKLADRYSHHTLVNVRPVVDARRSWKVSPRDRNKRLRRTLLYQAAWDVK